MPASMSWAVRISADGTLAQEIARAARQGAGRREHIEMLWQLQFVDRKVRAAVEGMFGIEPDIGLVNAVRKRCQGLSAKDIKASLGRAHFIPDFPQVSGPITKAQFRPRDPRPILSGQLPSPPGFLITICSRPVLSKRHSRWSASIRGRPSGPLSVRTAESCSAKRHSIRLSAAGGRAMQTVLGGTNPPACNGWDFWNFREQGEPVPIDVLRKQCIKARNELGQVAQAAEHATLTSNGHSDNIERRERGLYWQNGNKAAPPRTF